MQLASVRSLQALHRPAPPCTAYSEYDLVKL
jgi:hypothetical protein